jgi:hypothetical protein
MMFTKFQIHSLQAAYGALERVPVEALDKWRPVLESMTARQLEQIVQADIKFLAGIARNTINRRKASAAK